MSGALFARRGRQGERRADRAGRGRRAVLDASTAHRVAPRLDLRFPRLAPDQAGGSARRRRVSNPGCYSTGAIALLRPLVEAGLLPTDYPVTINAVTGYSGGGKTMIAGSRRHPPSFELYGLGSSTSTCPRRSAIRPGAAADLRALGRQFPSGHAGLGPAASRYAARQAEAPTSTRRWRSATRLQIRLGDTAQATHARADLEPEALNDTNMLELPVFASERAARRCWSRARQSRQGRIGRGRAEHAT